MALIPKEKKDEYRKKTLLKQKFERNKANLERGYALKDTEKRQLAKKTVIHFTLQVKHVQKYILILKEEQQAIKKYKLLTG